MDSNYELDRILKPHKILILQCLWSRQKHQKKASGTKSVQNLFIHEAGVLATPLVHGRIDFNLLLATAAISSSRNCD